MKNLRVYISIISFIIIIYLGFIAVANGYYGKYDGVLVKDGVILGQITVSVGPSFVPHFSGSRDRFPYFDVIAISEVEYEITDTSGEIVDKICWKSNRVDRIDAFYYLFDDEMCVWGGKYNIVEFDGKGPSKIGFGDEAIAYLEIVQ